MAPRTHQSKGCKMKNEAGLRRSTRKNKMTLKNWEVQFIVNWCIEEGTDAFCVKVAWDGWDNETWIYASDLHEPLETYPFLHPKTRTECLRNYKKYEIAKKQSAAATAASNLQPCDSDPLPPPQHNDNKIGLTVVDSSEDDDEVPPPVGLGLVGTDEDEEVCGGLRSVRPPGSSDDESTD